jgi:5'-3' exonuclease
MEFVDSVDNIIFHFVDVMSTLFLFLQFVDLCILLGCDYCDSIKGIGPKRAMDLIKQHRNLETILDNIDRNKYSITDDWLYSEARQIFLEPEVTNPDEIEVSFSRIQLSTVTCIENCNSNEGRRCKLKIPFYNIGSCKVSMVTGLWDG